jgi:homoserine kinase
MTVRVPASSANLGPGFDALGLALTLYAELGVVGVDPEPSGARRIDLHHPGCVAFARSGGVGELWELCPIPSGRGLGFSGAVRVGGAVLAQAQRHGAAWADRRDEVLAITAELEGHADNVAASLFGGVVATAGGRVVQVPLGIDPTVVVWVPSAQTATDASRKMLPSSVPFADATFNVGRTALLVAALAAGDVAALGDACRDRLHQDRRLGGSSPGRAALEGALAAGAWGAWLSGSGPTVAAWCDPASTDRVVDSLPPGGGVKVLAVDRQGAQVVRS